MNVMFVPPSPGEGYRWLPDPQWRTTAHGKRCRAGSGGTPVSGGSGHPACGMPAVAEMNRGQRRRGGKVDSWWAYCAEHTAGYFRAIQEDGRVWGWTWVES